MAEARKRYLRELAGNAADLLMSPSNGVRDTLIRSGKTPKDHIKDNKQLVKQIQKQIAIKKLEESKPAEKLFKLREFENIPARLSTSSTPRSTPKKQSQSSTPKNYIAGNILKARSTPVRELKEQKSPNYQDKLGVIPKYLIDRKLEWAKQEQERLIRLEQEKVPKGYKLLPDSDRISTLNVMRQQKQDCLYELQMLPLVMEKNSLKSKRQLIEERLLEAEAGIKLFTRKKVYIPIDSENSISR